MESNHFTSCKKIQDSHFFAALEPNLLLNKACTWYFQTFYEWISQEPEQGDDYRNGIWNMTVVIGFESQGFSCKMCPSVWLKWDQAKLRF